MDIDSNMQRFFGPAGDRPDDRASSFDYCFNYFQAFRDAGQVSEIASERNLQMSCLQLGFYLASWGMYRGSAKLLQKSARPLIPIVEVVSRTNRRLWEIDADSYTKSNVDLLVETANKISGARSDLQMSDTLQTKIMLAVFGNTPAFDTNFRKGCKVEGITATFGPKALTQIGAFYQQNSGKIDGYQERITTIEFESGKPTKRRYTRAKIIDMAFVMDNWA